MSFLTEAAVFGVVVYLLLAATLRLKGYKTGNWVSGRSNYSVRSILAGLSYGLFLGTVIAFFHAAVGLWLPVAVLIGGVAMLIAGSLLGRLLCRSCPIK